MTVTFGTVTTPPAMASNLQRGDHLVGHRLRQLGAVFKDVPVPMIVFGNGLYQTDGFRRPTRRAAAAPRTPSQNVVTDTSTLMSSDLAMGSTFMVINDAIASTQYTWGIPGGAAHQGRRARGYADRVRRVRLRERRRDGGRAPAPARRVAIGWKTERGQGADPRRLQAARRRVQLGRGGASDVVASSEWFRRDRRLRGGTVAGARAGRRITVVRARRAVATHARGGRRRRRGHRRRRRVRQSARRRRAARRADAGRSRLHQAGLVHAGRAASTAASSATAVRARSIAAPVPAIRFATRGCASAVPAASPPPAARRPRAATTTAATSATAAAARSRAATARPAAPAPAGCASRPTACR